MNAKITIARQIIIYGSGSTQLPAPSESGEILVAKTTTPGDVEFKTIEEAGIAKKSDLVQLADEKIDKFTALPDRSFSNMPQVDYGHLWNYTSPDNNGPYIVSAKFATIWVQIFNDSGKLDVSGVAVTRYNYFNALLPSKEAYIKASSNTIPVGAKLALITVSKDNNPDGYLNLKIRQNGSGVERKEFADSNLATKNELRNINDSFIQYPRGKNWLNPRENLKGWTISSGQLIESPNGELSNKMFLRKGDFITISKVKAYSANTNNYLGYFDVHDNYISRTSHPIVDEASSFVYNPPAGTYYARLVLNSGSLGSTYNPDVAQVELGSIATEFEKFKGSLLSTGELGNVENNVLMTGASFAFPGNPWFEIMCNDLKITGFNKAVSGETMRDTAIKMHEGALYSKNEFENFGILLIFHSHNQIVDSETNIKTNYNDYIFPIEDRSAQWDYVLKKYTAECLEAKDDHTSRWYGSKLGKPCYICVCTHWHDSRAIFNDSIRRLKNKWGFNLIEIDKQIGFSKNQKHSVTNNQTSLLYSVDTEKIDNVVYGWHPDRSQNASIQQKMANIIAKNI